MSNSDTETVDENKPPARSQSQTSASPDEEVIKIPKHLRSRYWNSWEEMRLIEMWRLHSDEVTTLKQNIPIFRTISEGMREYGFLVNAQEVRRKINTFKNKYIAERRRMDQSDNQKPSDWRLYPLVHCLLAPRQKNQLLTHQKLILDQLFSKIPADLLNKELPASEKLVRKTIQQLPSFVENKPELNFVPPPTHQRYQPRFQPYVRTMNESAFIFRNTFTKERLTQIRVDNSILYDQRDAALKQLKSEERSFKALESFLMNWQKKHEFVLQRLQCADGK